MQRRWTIEKTHGDRIRINGWRLGLLICCSLIRIDAEAANHPPKKPTVKVAKGQLQIKPQSNIAKKPKIASPKAPPVKAPEPLPFIDADFTRLPGGCIRDNTTGLVWENKTDDGGVQDTDDRYSWFNTHESSTGGFPGYPKNRNAHCFGYKDNEEKTWCNTHAYVQRVNLSRLCGFNDWRLPKRDELRSLVDQDVPRPNPTLNTAFFPNTRPAWYWTSSMIAPHSNFVWLVSFEHGYDGVGSQDDANAVRLVRGGGQDH